MALKIRHGALTGTPRDGAGAYFTLDGSREGTVGLALISYGVKSGRKGEAGKVVQLWPAAGQHRVQALRVQMEGGLGNQLASDGADVLYTDVWASMGEEHEAELRKKVFKGYQINDSVMAAANEGSMVMHCLPAHRGEEITAEVFEAHADEIFDEAENRLHAQKAVLVACMR